MIQKLITLVCLSLFLTACTATTASDEAAPAAVTDDSTPTAPTPNNPTIDSFKKASDNAIADKEDKTLTFNAIGVQAQYNNSSLEIRNFGISNFALTFDANGEMSHVKFADGPYESYNISDEYSTNIELDGFLNIDGTDNGGETSNSQIIVNRAFDNSSADNDYDFTSDYMVSVYWVDDNQVNVGNYDKGYLVAGFETVTIPTTAGSTLFVGNGEGRYHDGTNSHGAEFDVMADVTFSTRMVELSTSNSNYYNANAAVEIVDSNLDINTTLSYATGANAISNVAAATLDVNGSTLTANAGDINARFYGTGANAAKEFGGAFNFSNADNSNFYYGFFGTKIVGIVHANGVITNTDGTFTAPVGATINDDGGIVHANGVVTKLDGTFTAPVGATINDDGGIVHPNGVVTKLDGSFMAPVGATINDDGGITNMDGTVTNLNNTTTHPNGVTDNGDGTFTAPDGKTANGDGDIVNIDGTLTKLDGTTTNADGSVTHANGIALKDGAIVNPFGTTTNGDGTYTYPNGTIVNPDGGIVNANGVITELNNTFTHPDGKPLNATGGIKNPNGVITELDNSFTHPDGKTINATGGIKNPNGVITELDNSFTHTDSNITITATGGIENPNGVITELNGSFTAPDGANINVTGGIVDTNNAVTILDGTILPPTTLTTLTSFSDSNRASTKNNVLTVSNAVQMNKANNSNVISSQNLLNTLVQFDYHADGGFDHVDSLRFYFDGKQYSATNASASDGYIYDYDVDSGTADTPDYFGIDNDSFAFGFNPEYMALIYWKLNDNVDYNAYGYGIFGWETAGSGIPTAEASVSFIGKGDGHHYFNAISEDIYFDVEIDIDFTASTEQVTFSTINSCADDCGTGDDRAYLDFTNQKLSYAAQTNAISGNVETAGGLDGNNTNWSQLAGTANARFYGTGADVAIELGGTFNVSNSVTTSTDQTVNVWDANANGGVGAWVETIETITETTDPNRSYVGWFGARSIASIDKPEQSDLNANGLTSFNDRTRVGTTNALPVFNSVEMKQSGNNSISTQNHESVVVEFEYLVDDDDLFYEADGDGDFADGESLSLYFSHKKYSANDAHGSADFLYDSDVESGSADTPDSFGVNKEEDLFGFAPEYMALIYWNLYDNVDYESTGFGITGFETKNADLPITGSAVSFTGKGDGHHYFNAISENIYFDVALNVDFVNRSLGLTTTGSCADDCEVGDERDYLDFSNQALSYDVGINAITGSVETDGGVDGNNTNWSQLSGTLNAKFYGPNADELGGTFAVSNNSNRGYVGWFGAERDYVASIDKPETADVNANGLTSFDDVNNKGKRDNILPIHSAVTIKTTISDNSHSSATITDAVVEFDYYKNNAGTVGTADETPLFDDYDSLSIYFNDKKYAATYADGYAEYIEDEYIDSGTANIPDSFGLYRRDSEFGFTPKYMALVYWQVTDSDSYGYKEYGYGITGFETATLPTGNAVIVFSGKGDGEYRFHNGSNTPVYFDVQVNVNFANRDIKLTTLNTCTTRNCNGNDNLSYDEIDFTNQTLTYTASSNAATGNIQTDGQSGVWAKLSGTANARFYGPEAKEVGGTFSVDLTGNNVEYVGWFGANRP